MNKECHKVPCRFRLSPCSVEVFPLKKGLPRNVWELCSSTKNISAPFLRKRTKFLFDSSLFRALRYLVYFQKRNVKHLFLRISIKICQKYSIFVLRVIRSHWHYQACPASDWKVTYLRVDPIHYSVPLYNNHCSLQQNSRTLTFVERCTMYYVDLAKPKS